MGDSQGLLPSGIAEYLDLLVSPASVPAERHELGDTGASLWWRRCSLKTETH